MKHLLYFLIIIIVYNCNIPNELNFEFNCQDTEEISKSWTDQTRIYIIQSHVLNSPINNRKFSLEALSGLGIDKSKKLKDSQLSTHIIQAKDPTFSYIKKRRSNNLLYFNAILVNKKLNGCAEWFNKNGDYELIGHFFNNKPVGKWKYFGENNIVDTIIYKGNCEQLKQLTDSSFTGHLK